MYGRLLKGRFFCESEIEENSLFDPYGVASDEQLWEGLGIWSMEQLTSFWVEH